MKCSIPEISWHNRDPVFSIDFQPLRDNENFYRLASGGTDSHVLVRYDIVYHGFSCVLPSQVVKMICKCLKILSCCTSASGFFVNIFFIDQILTNTIEQEFPKYGLSVYLILL